MPLYSLSHSQPHRHRPADARAEQQCHTARGRRRPPGRFLSVSDNRRDNPGNQSGVYFHPRTGHRIADHGKRPSPVAALPPRGYPVHNQLVVDKKADERPVRDRSSSSAALPSRSRKPKLSHLSASRTRVGGARRRPRHKAKPKVGKSVHKMASASLPKAYGPRPPPVRYRDD